MSVEDFAYLWTSPPGTYVLERFNVEGEEVLLICRPQDGTVELIDDDELHSQIVERMIAAGVEITD